MNDTAEEFDGPDEITGLKDDIERLSSLLSTARADGAVLTEIVTQIDQAIYANEDGGEYQWRNSEVLEMLRMFRTVVPLTIEEKK